METKNRTIMILGLVFCLMISSSAFGQIIYGQKSSGDISMIYSYWKVDSQLGEAKISQFSVPLGGFIPLQDNFEARFYIGNAMNKLEVGGTDYKLSGLGDLRVQFNHSFEDDKYLLSLGLNLPTGKKELNTSEEEYIIDLLSSAFLTFPIRRLGEGFGVNAMAGAATFWNDIRAGISAMYQFNGKYDPYEDIADYDPGDFFTVSASADMKRNDWSYLANLAYTLYTTDKQDGNDIFRQANNLDARLSATHYKGNIDYSGTIRLLLRGENSYYDILSNRFDEKLFGNEFSIFLNANIHPAKKWSVTPVVEFTSIADNDNNDGSSSLFGFGGDYFTRLSESFNLRIGAKYYIGSASDGDIDITGFQLSTSLMAGF